MNSDLLRPGAPAVFDVAAFARRLLIASAAATGLIGILAGRPLHTVAFRAGAVLVAGWLAIHVAILVCRRLGAGGPR